MGNRERYSIELVCPKCGLSGRANVSENEIPYRDKFNFKFDKLTEGFTVVSTADRCSGSLVKCQCGEEFNASQESLKILR